MMPKLDLKITEDGMSYNREGVWTAQEVQDKLGEYLESGGDPQLLVRPGSGSKDLPPRVFRARIFSLLYYYALLLGR
mgnify:CR=1 FL=1